MRLVCAGEGDELDRVARDRAGDRGERLADPFGAEFCDALSASHAAYGEALGITKPKDAKPTAALAPKYWARTRATLDERELELPIGHVTVPPHPAEQQPSTS